MTGPSPRQQAGYLKRLLRRGDIEVVDPSTGKPVSALVSLAGRTIRIIPAPERLFETAGGNGTDETRWKHVFRRLRESLSVEDAEELLRAVDYERRRKR